MNEISTSLFKVNIDFLQAKAKLDTIFKPFIDENYVNDLIEITYKEINMKNLKQSIIKILYYFERLKSLSHEKNAASIILDEFAKIFSITNFVNQSFSKLRLDKYIYPIIPPSNIFNLNIQIKKFIDNSINQLNFINNKKINGYQQGYLNTEGVFNNSNSNAQMKKLQKENWEFKVKGKNDQEQTKLLLQDTHNNSNNNDNKKDHENNNNNFNVSFNANSCKIKPAPIIISQNQNPRDQQNLIMNKANQSNNLNCYNYSNFDMNPTIPTISTQPSLDGKSILNNELNQNMMNYISYMNNINNTNYNNNSNAQIFFDFINSKNLKANGKRPPFSKNLSNGIHETNNNPFKEDFHLLGHKSLKNNNIDINNNTFYNLYPFNNSMKNKKISNNNVFSKEENDSKSLINSFPENCNNFRLQSLKFSTTKKPTTKSNCKKLNNYNSNSISNCLENIMLVEPLNHEVSDIFKPEGNQKEIDQNYSALVANLKHQDNSDAENHFDFADIEKQRQLSIGNGNETKKDSKSTKTEIDDFIRALVNGEIALVKLEDFPNSRLPKLNYRADCIRKRIKTFINNYILNNLNDIVKGFGSNVFFLKLPKELIVNIKIDYNYALFNMTLKELYSTKVSDQKEEARVTHNMKMMNSIIHPNFQAYARKKFKDVFLEYLHSEQYIKDLKYLAEKENKEYLKLYQQHVNSFLEYFNIKSS